MLGFISERASSPPLASAWCLASCSASARWISSTTTLFANGSRFPKNGHIVHFGTHRIYLGTVPESRYPSKVLVVSDPPVYATARGSHTGRTAGSVEVMMASSADADKGAAGENAAPTKSRRQAKHPLEWHENIADTSNMPAAVTPLQAAMNVLSTPITPNADATATQAELEA
jgi:hypothetical protein